jgi:hypothetical protein
MKGEGMKKGWIKRISLILVFSMMVISLGRAAMFRWQEKERAIRQACQGAQQKAGADCPTPEIHMITSSCIQPGGSGEVVIKGKFPPGTKFVFENDNLEVVSESLMGTVYKATLKAAAGIGPQDASVSAISPCCKSARHEKGAVVGGKYEWNLQVSNGWRIFAKLLSDNRCGASKGEGQSTYELQFYRGNETAPFEKRQGSLFFSQFEKTQYRFSIDQTDSSAKNAQEELQAIVKKMMDPSISEDERAKIMKKMETLQQQMVANMQKMTNPAEVQKMEQKRQEFGCEAMELQVSAASVQGSMRCAEKVGRNIPLTGTLKYLGQ